MLNERDLELIGGVVTKAIEPVREEVKELRKDVTELQVGMKELRKDVTELQVGMKELRADVTELQVEVKELRADVTELQVKRCDKTSRGCSGASDWNGETQYRC